MKKFLIFTVVFLSSLSFSQTEIELYSIELKFTFWLGTDDYKLDVYPTFLVTSPLTDKLTPRYGMGVPYMILVDNVYKNSLENGYTTNLGPDMPAYGYKEFLYEEYSHSRVQFGALGPLFPFLYFPSLLGDSQFEPYIASCYLLKNCTQEENEYFNWDKMNLAMFEPYKDNCSLFSITNDSFDLLPCYTQW